MSHLAGIYAKVPINITEIPQEVLNIENKIRHNPLQWSGQFSPQLIQSLLQRYATPHSVVFDPFLGSGTVILESGIIGLEASGTEINPAAIALSRIYQFINISFEARYVSLQKLSDLLYKEFALQLPLFRLIDVREAGIQNTETIETKLLRLVSTAENLLQHQLLEALVVLLDFYQPDLSVEKVFRLWKKLKQLVMELPFSTKQLNIFHADARCSPLQNDSINLVITSPPYINVFNYHQQYRLSAESLNWNMLNVAKSEIGANRKHRSNRFLTVIQYCLDMAQVLGELKRVCRKNARLIFIVGKESTVRRTPFFNGEIVTEVACRTLGFDLIGRQERVFRNRFGQNIFEDILHLTPSKGQIHESFLDSARMVAQEILESTRSYVSDEAREDLEMALININNVQSSHLFKLSEVMKSSHSREKEV